MSAPHLIWADFPRRVRPTTGKATAMVQTFTVAGLPAVAWTLKERGLLAGAGVVLLAVGAIVAAWPMSQGSSSSARSRVAIVLLVGCVIAAAPLAGRPAALSLLFGAAVLRRLLRLAVSGGVPTAGPVVIAVAAAVLLRQGLVVAGLIIQLASFALTSAPDATWLVHRSVTDAVSRIMHAAAYLLSTSMMAVSWLILVILPWSVQRLLRWDPTWQPHPEGSRMVPRRPEPSDARRTWARDPSTLRPGLSRRLHRAVMVTVIVCGMAFLVVVAPPLTQRPAYKEPQAAMADSPWWSTEARVQSLTFDEARVSGYQGPILADVESSYTNVEAGIRRTWEPDTPPVLTVWMFGGSTLFGIGQRDEHTIPSELAKAANASGLSLRVVNHGVHGDLHWMEARRLTAALASSASSPDLVVFYDGFNDLATVNLVNLRGSTVLLENQFVGTLDTGSFFPGSRPGLVDQVVDLVWGSREASRGDRPLTDREAVDFATRQYQETVADTLRDMEARSLEGVVVYQPSRVTRSVSVSGEGTDSLDYRRMEQRFRLSLPDEVIDLSGALDSVPDPVYWDAVHTNELGARVVATALLDELWPRLERLTNPASES